LPLDRADAIDRLVERQHSAHSRGLSLRGEIGLREVLGDLDRLFCLRSRDELPDLNTFDPAPELEAESRERLLQAGEARAGDVTTGRRSRPTSECNLLCIV